MLRFASQACGGTTRGSFQSHETRMPIAWKSVVSKEISEFAGCMNAVIEIDHLHWLARVALKQSSSFSADAVMTAPVSSSTCL